jgi:RNA polymerase primary sigma factor
MAGSLDAAEQDELLRRAAGGDKASQERLVEAFLPAVVRLAAAREEQRMPLADLVQEGSIGLIQAIRTFSASGEADFERFAEARIAAQLDEALEVEAAALREELLLASEDYDRVEMLLARELHRPPTEAEIAQKLEWTGERTRYVAQAVAEARRRHDAELLEYIDPEAIDIDGLTEIDPNLN